MEVNMEKTVEYIAKLMEVAAVTAPKAVGKNYVVTEIVSGRAVQKLGKEMIAYGERTGKKNFDRDGKNVEESECVLLVGIKDAKPVGLDCGACGSATCIDINDMDETAPFLGPQCLFRVLDMGIAIGSAVKTASILNADNRIMYRIGCVARELKMIDADFVMGIPLSVTGKSIYFDR